MATAFFSIKKVPSESEIRESIRRAYDPVFQNCCRMDNARHPSDLDARSIIRRLDGGRLVVTHLE